MKNTVERISPEYLKTKEKYLLYLRHEFAYNYAISQMDSDDLVLEIGFGEGYGTARLASTSLPSRRWTRNPFPDGHFDAVASFQVIKYVQ